MRGDKTLLEIEDMNVSIHKDQILTNVSLSAKKGKVLGIIGESGSGKSMTALSIMQLLPRGARTSGKIVFDGQSLTEMDESELCELRGSEVSMIFQEPMTALNPVLTIGQQVAECIELHSDVSRKAARALARETLERVGLPATEFPLSRYPHELSGGQRQRVVIAIAVALEPKLLIADEPTTALDVTTQAEILALLKSLTQSSSMSLILISHDLAVVSDMADDIVIMRDGGIVDGGPTREFFSEINHPYTRQLFEASRHVPERHTHKNADGPLLEVTDLVCEYAKSRIRLFGTAPVFRAVDKVDLRINVGESVGLVGESGCGKSTLTKALLGLMPIANGTVTIGGDRVVAGQALSRKVRQQMQIVFQDPYGSFNPRHRVERLVAEPLHVLDSQPDRRTRAKLVNESLENVGLETRDARKYIHEFSGGQRQRIAIARALIIRPPLIILDEAVSALDVSVRAQVLDLLAELANRYHISYLFISHDLSVVRSITDRVLVMQRGRVVERGETEAIFNEPQHPYTKSLLAAAPTLPVDTVY